MGREIVVCTFIAPGSGLYADFLRRSMEKFKTGDIDIKYVYVASNGGDKVGKGWEKIAETADVGHNSMNHAIALNEALHYIQKDQKTIFCDADIAITHEGWDQCVETMLGFVDCWGWAYDNEGPRYRDFPCVFFFAFRQLMLEYADLDFRPRVPHGQEAVERFELTKDEGKLMNRRKGSQIKCDTGWALPMQIRSQGCTSRSLPCVWGKDKARLLPFKDKEMKKKCLSKPAHMSEWHSQGELFGTHKQASRSMGFDSEWGKIWRWRINEYCKVKYGTGLE